MKKYPYQDLNKEPLAEAAMLYQLRYTGQIFRIFLTQGSLDEKGSRVLSRITRREGITKLKIILTGHYYSGVPWSLPLSPWLACSGFQRSGGALEFGISRVASANSTTVKRHFDDLARIAAAQRTVRELFPQYPPNFSRTVQLAEHWQLKLKGSCVEFRPKHVFTQLEILTGLNCSPEIYLDI